MATSTTLARLRNVTVRFGETVALRDVDLCISVGERVGLLGPSGAGKSTLLGVLGARVVPDKGEAEILGTASHDLRGRSARAVRGRIGTVHQDLALTDRLRVIHNVNAGRLAEWSTLRALRSLLIPVERARVEAVLEAVDIADKIDEPTSDLSGGQRQRVAIARLLIQDPDLVLADEPAASLDPELGRLMMQLLRDVAATDARALVVSLHDPGLAMSTCNRLVGLREGRVVFDRPIDDVSATDIEAVYHR
ncbi:phosphonate ABC transporter ATP-binding protein [Actinospongicola halichondriae]|uniref:phosphonate ABC transporter ATP-binding protein n=1 Tax=Actinospongicola halichondriae TaxID=3236844 RepID=UPI003D5471CC